jgi:hypothetical protein
MTSLRRLIVVFVAVCVFGLAPQPNSQPARASVETTQAANGATVTRIKVNGQFSSTLLKKLAPSSDRVLAHQRDRPQ